jgi:hypothetical protein
VSPETEQRFVERAVAAGLVRDEDIARIRRDV